DHGGNYPRDWYRADHSHSVGGKVILSRAKRALRTGTRRNNAALHVGAQIEKLSKRRLRARIKGEHQIACSNHVSAGLSKLPASKGARPRRHRGPFCQWSMLTRWAPVIIVLFLPLAVRAGGALGPASRSTALVISEIMYHPLAE